MAALALALIGWTAPSAGALAEPVCKPDVVIQNARLTTPFNLRRYWTATVTVDATACAATSGLFAIGFLRESETGPDLEFTEPFIWEPGDMGVRVEFWADEAVGRYWLAHVAPCICRPAR